MSVFVASGDDGVAGCEDAKATTAVHGASVNGICSTPFDVCVGGTQFLDAVNPTTYWAAANDPATKASALSYIPEETWNESGGSCGPLCASGGGASTVYSKPIWQVGLGVPAPNHRYVPDLSVAGATHDAYLTVVNGMSGLTGFGGTSVSSPALAGIYALVVQRFGAQGNPNPNLYRIAAAQFAGAGPVVFHDITQGDNSVPGAAGFTAGPGYDQATGIGSLDASALVANWVGAGPPSAQRTPPVLVSPGSRSTRVRPFH
jgi:subtilase family serine protease